MEICRIVNGKNIRFMALIIASSFSFASLISERHDEDAPVKLKTTCVSKVKNGTPFKKHR